MNAGRYLNVALMVLIFVGAWLLFATQAHAHCDTMDGPVIIDAKLALSNGDVTPVLKWIKKEFEAEIRSAFEKTMAVRVKGQQAKELADMYFFETLVRLHRAGEGAPFTGLKPSGAEMEPAVQGADKALETGSADSLIKMVNKDVAAGIQERFARALEAKKHVNESVEVGRRYVEAYVEYVHYVERLHTDAIGHGVVHGHLKGEDAESEHHHEE